MFKWEVIRQSDVLQLQEVGVPIAIGIEAQNFQPALIFIEKLNFIYPLNRQFLIGAVICRFSINRHLKSVIVPLAFFASSDGNL